MLREGQRERNAAQKKRKNSHRQEISQRHQDAGVGRRRECRISIRQKNPRPSNLYPKQSLYVLLLPEETRPRRWRDHYPHRKSIKRGG